MSQYPGGPPPYYPPTWPHPPHHPHPPHNPHHPPHYPPPHHPHYPPPPDGGQVTAPPAMPYYGTVMIPVPIPQPPQPTVESQPTYITNYIYHGETTHTDGGVSVAETAGEHDWVPTTSTMASTLTGRAVVGGHEGWDGSPLWVIRAWYNGDLIPGKLSVRHNSASVMYDGKEITVQNIEVLCAKPETLRWIPSSNGSVPPGAIVGGRTASGEELYVGRARYQLSVTPGKVHPSHHSCYIGFGGAEVAHKMYDVLCRSS
ncbi:BUB3-interacting and GLEBS motif-containing protein ZNF207 [Manduca sexta]|uniref:Farnesoic acid O-methyltransferase n=1 Tax=Manduca sexta TaxID=7130 RepID=A0A921YTD4_MANSE|nr:BUB3-interacting and GLEBS motif-containing protein ZNF207 [Manduca sexta]KAG6444242.1 hypothetical protein O3G_MSEX003311 [Manduca sexta]